MGINIAGSIISGKNNITVNGNGSDSAAVISRLEELLKIKDREIKERDKRIGILEEKLNLKSKGK